MYSGEHNAGESEPAAEDGAGCRLDSNPPRPTKGALQPRPSCRYSVRRPVMERCEQRPASCDNERPEPDFHVANGEFEVRADSSNVSLGRDIIVDRVIDLRGDALGNVAFDVSTLQGSGQGQAIGHLQFKWFGRG